MSPGLASTEGGVPIALTGAFPIGVLVYVWFGDLAIVETFSDGSTLQITSPAVITSATDTVVDVVVKFRTTRSHELRLRDAFTFHRPHSTTATTTTTTTAPNSGGATTDGSTTDGSTTGGVSGPRRTGSLGSLTLYAPTPGHPIADLTPGAWPTTGCTSANCSST